MNKKILNILLTIIVILVVVIFGAIYYMVTQNRASSSVYDDLTAQNNNASYEENVIEENNVDKDNTVEVTSEEPPVGTLVTTDAVKPFTGAFPSIDILPFLFEENDITQFSNEQILRLGFSKVTKDDWADTYISEGEPVSIPASLLDTYIKEIFGENVQYEKKNFSNKDFCIDKDMPAHTSSYEAVYSPETDTYTINHVPGDGINENYVQLFDPRVSKIQNQTEMEMPYLFVVYGDEMVSGEVDGQEIQGFEYIVYANCDYKTKTFSEELGRFTEFDKDANGNFSVEDHVMDIANDNIAKMQKIRFIYELNENGTRYNLKEIKK